MFDFIYAADSAQGLIHLALTDDAEGVLNLGTGAAQKISDVVDILKQHFPEMVVKYEETDIDFEASQADMTQFEKVIRWRTEYTLDTVIPEMIAYEKQNRVEGTSKRDLNVLISSASRKTPLIRAVQKAVRALGPDIKVIAGDLDENALGQYVADEFWPMPTTEASSIEVLLKGCKNYEIGFIIPTRDGELTFWAESAAVFRAEGIEVMVSSPDATRRCLDKLEFATFGQEKNLPFIPASPSIEIHHFIHGQYRRAIVIARKCGKKACNHGRKCNRNFQF